jgi:hypothetical protein
MQIKKVYSPGQTFGGAFLGGPVAATYFIYRNFQALDDIINAKKALLIGFVSLIVLFCATIFLVDVDLGILIPLAYSFGASHIVSSFQFDKEKIKQSDSFDFVSEWQVIGITIISFIIVLAIFVGGITLLDTAGLLPPT